MGKAPRRGRLCQYVLITSPAAKPSGCGVGPCGVTIVSGGPHEMLAQDDARLRVHCRNRLQEPSEQCFAGDVRTRGHMIMVRPGRSSRLRRRVRGAPYFRSGWPSRAAILLHSAAVASMIPGPNPLSL
jgi:hypothetical protein